MNVFIDKNFRRPRIWSNRELEKIAWRFKGNIINVSAWEDNDKEGRKYRDYFSNAAKYFTTNYENVREGDMPLDLEKSLPKKLYKKFDVVFNHTCLEHIYDCKTAMKNLCKMSKDIVIVVVPFLQMYHKSPEDYWRFTPTALKRMFQENGFSTIYTSFNTEKNLPVYIFMVASCHPEHWEGEQEEELFGKNVPGNKAISNTLNETENRARRFFAKLLRIIKLLN